MPELTATHLGLLALTVLVGIVLGWISRGGRCAREKAAVSAGWQSQIDGQQSENDRLASQNKSLMEQISQYQASNKDSTLRARELSASLKEAFERRDELQRQLKQARSDLEVAEAQRDRLQADLRSRDVRGEAADSALKEKDEKIFRLSRELSSWQQRVPPLVERFRDRDEEARTLEERLNEANERIAALGGGGADTTRIEPVGGNSLPEGMDASNEPHSVTSLNETLDVDDQIEDQIGTAEAVAEVDDDYAEQDDDRDERRESATGEYSGVYLGNVGDAALAADADEDTESDSVEETAEDDDESVAEAHTDIADEERHESETTDGPADDPVEAGGALAAPIDLGAAPGVRDDLQLIKGVGPAIEKTLNDLGICRFNQIAEMSEFDIDRVAQQLKGFRTRIYREDWIGQARLLQYQKNNDLA